MIAEIQVLPSPAGTSARQWAHVEAAIDVIASSGLVYEVGALGTSLEGAPDAVWDTIRRAHESALAHGALNVVSVVKVFEGTGDGPTMRDVTASYRG